eukprot:gene53526-73189_t
MRLDGRALRAAGGEVRECRFLCRTEIGRFRAALNEGRPVTVGCTQEAPLFQEIAEEAGFAAPLVFANIREAAGWADEGARA